LIHGPGAEDQDHNKTVEKKSTTKEDTRFLNKRKKKKEPEKTNKRQIEYKKWSPTRRAEKHVEHHSQGSSTSLHQKAHGGRYREHSFTRTKEGMYTKN